MLPQLTEWPKSQRIKKRKQLRMTYKRILIYVTACMHGERECVCWVHMSCQAKQNPTTVKTAGPEKQINVPFPHPSQLPFSSIHTELRWSWEHLFHYLFYFIFLIGKKEILLMINRKKNTKCSRDEHLRYAVV